MPPLSHQRTRGAPEIAGTPLNVKKSLGLFLGRNNTIFGERQAELHSHSIVAASICMVSRFSSCRLVRLLSRNPNHFVITGVITNLLNSDLTAAFRNDSLAITPRNTNGDDGRWFAMA